MSANNSRDGDLSPREKSPVGLIAGLAILLLIVPAILIFRTSPPTQQQQLVLPPADLSVGKQFLDESEAFQVSASIDGRNEVRATFLVADGYYLYRKKINLVAIGDGLLLQPALPAGEIKTDPYFGKSFVLRRQFEVTAKLSEPTGKSDLKLQVSYQGCADDGICYPPISRILMVKRVDSLTR